MARVYEAEHLRLGHRVAVKLLLRETLASNSSVTRFRREAQLLAQLSDDHVVRILDCGELDDATPFLVMELLEGADLQQVLIESGRLPAVRALNLALDVARGLAVVHGAGLVHRDIKPSNLFVVRLPHGGERCKILDFGVAKQPAGASTQEGSLIGTLRYMAPEQLQNPASAVPASDVYSVGAVLYECLAGAPLHGAETVQELMADILNFDGWRAGQEPPFPAPVVEMLSRALQRDPERRLADGAVLASYIEALLPRGSCRQCLTNVTNSTTVDERPLRPPRRRARALTRAVLALAGPTALGLWFTTGREDADSAPLVAERAQPPPMLSVSGAASSAAEATSSSAAVAIASAGAVREPSSAPSAVLGSAKSPAERKRVVRPPSDSEPLHLEERNPYSF